MLSELSASLVAERLGLGADYQPWLALLESVGTTAVSLPQDDEAETVLRRLGLTEPDLSAILAEMPSPSGQPALWWLFERTVHAVRLDIGQPDVLRSWPSLPAHLGIQGRCFWIWVYVAAVPDIRRWHRAHGVADDVSWNTLADLGRHIRLYRLHTGNIGFNEQFWFALHFRGGIFELGRLQFNPYLLAERGRPAHCSGTRTRRARRLARDSVGGTQRWGCTSPSRDRSRRQPATRPFTPPASSSPTCFPPRRTASPRARRG